MEEAWTLWRSSEETISARFTNKRQIEAGEGKEEKEEKKEEEEEEKE